VQDFLKPTSGTFVAQPVLFNIRGDLDDLPIVQGEVPPDIIICLWLHILVRFHECEVSFFSVKTYWNDSCLFYCCIYGKICLDLRFINQRCWSGNCLRRNFVEWVLIDFFIFTLEIINSSIEEKSFTFIIRDQELL